MRYVSTRGDAPAVGFEGALLAGLAPDGGLYVPETWPALDRDLHGLDYAETAAAVLAPFTAGALDEAALLAMAKEVYAGFDHPATTPLVQVGPDRWMMELFHGPTLAFKDCAMQLLGRLFETVLARRGERLTIVGATSGDTGAAAVAALAGLESVDVAILHPLDRVSPVQRRQMTTVTAPNVTNIAVQGTFDDCQDLVKAMFADRPFADAMRLGGINSINWARIAAQAVYYAFAATRLQGPVHFVVPTGNFGNVFAGYVAKRLGLPIGRLVVATNVNDILARFFQSGGTYAAEGVQATLSPSMDIQVASNFERALFEAHGRDAAAVRGLMARFKQSRSFTVEADAFAELGRHFGAGRADEAATVARLRWAAANGLGVLDPHTAVGLEVALGLDLDGPVVTLATAHAAKFPAAAEAANLALPPLPASMADLFEREERFTVLANDLDTVEAHIRGAFR
ncbi:MAG: threonine synthase [Geminicoccaceae bacterium]|nr:MAG: threonine synthase [Geminicoccaceae bacterium]